MSDTSLLSAKHMLVFNALAQLSAVLNMEEPELMSSIADSEELATTYIELASLVEAGLELEDYGNLCNELNKSYSDIGLALESLKDSLKESIKEVN